MEGGHSNSNSPSPSMHHSPPNTSSSSSNNNDMKSKRSVSSFVSESFARFESTYPQLSSSSKDHIHNDHLQREPQPTITASTDSQQRRHFPLWTSLITYLPLLLFSICRTTYFGASSLLRTVFLGFVVRLILDALKFGMPPSFVDGMERRWEEMAEVQISWMSRLLSSWDGIGGDLENHPSHPPPDHQHHKKNGHNHSDNHKDAWPVPPGLTLLTLVTGLAFLIHPDGLTWIIVGKLLDGIIYLVTMLRDEPIHTIAAAASLSSIALLGGIIHKTLSPKTNNNSHRGPSNTTNGNNGNATPSRKKKGRHRKGGGHHGNHNHRSRGKHNRGGGASSQAGIEKNDSPPSRLRLDDSPSSPRSRSPTTSSLQSESIIVSSNKHHDEQCRESSTATTTIKSNDNDDDEDATVKEIGIAQHSNDLSLKPTTIHSQSRHSLGSDDVSSCCSSITVSLNMDNGIVPPSPSYSSRDEPRSNDYFADKKGGNNTNNNNRQQRRKHKNQSRQHQSREKYTAAVGSRQSQTATPGYVERDYANSTTPSRVSPLPMPNHPVLSYNNTTSSLLTPTRNLHRPPVHKAANHRSRASTADGIVGIINIATDNRTRTNTTDGITAKQNQNHHSYHHISSSPGRSNNLTTNNNNVNIASTNHRSTAEFQQQHFNPQLPESMRYNNNHNNIPLNNFSAAYTLNNSNNSQQQKMELAAFLNRVNLISGSNLLRDIPDVDTLASMTPHQLYLYNVSDEKQMEIAALLKARELSLLHYQQGAMTSLNRSTVTPSPPSSSPVVVRPPPGLGFTTPAEVVQQQQQQQHPISKPFIASSGSFGSADSNTNNTPEVLLASSAVGRYGNHNASNNQYYNYHHQPLRSSSQQSIVGVGNIQPSTATTMPSHPILPIGSSRTTTNNSNHRVVVEQTEDEKIDADLQQLGNRMAGSILDF